MGVILGSYDTIAALIAAHPTGAQGDAYLVGSGLYVWNVATNQWESVGNLQGPTGATGMILGSYDTIAALIQAHPTGNQGDAYLVGGELYVWDAETNQWERVGNLQGPTGATGATGAMGSILGSYDTIAEMIQAHPTGNQGDAYLVGGELYVWNAATTQWERVGDLQGPTGPTGPTGADGADGVIGRIDGVVATADDLPEADIEQGTIYYVQDTDSAYVWDEDAGWVSLGMVQGPRGATGATGATGADGLIGEIAGVVENVADLPTTGVAQGTIYYVENDDGIYVWDAQSGWTRLSAIQGPRGATGATGPVGTILGSYDSLADLQNAHPTGNQGDMYLVDGVLYVWDEDNNAWRAVGDLRPVTEAVTIIPFASQVAPRTFINGGVPARVSLIGFGYGDTRDDLLDNYSFGVNSDNTFVLEGDNGNRQVVFSLPFDMIIRSIALTTGNWAQYPAPLAGTVYPFVQLFAAPPTSNTFLPLAGAMAIPETGHGPGNVPANTMLSALTENLNVRLRAGTRIAIGAQARIDGDTEARDYYLYFTGGIGMTRWVE